MIQKYGLVMSLLLALADVFLTSALFYMALNFMANWKYPLPRMGFLEVLAVMLVAVPFKFIIIDDVMDAFGRDQKRAEQMKLELEKLHSGEKADAGKKGDAQDKTDQ
jgi:hypothetical protein